MKERINAPQTATPVAQRVQAPAQADNRASTVQAKGLLEAIAASPRQVAQRAAAEAIDSSPRQVAQRAAVAQFQAPPPNRTGLPDKLKAGVESLSGHSLDDVRVHYNSARPAQLQAHAYAQGSEIHVAPGQEKHLPHEAWHVVQQKQGRVRATTQMKGVGVNDDSALEREADVMGARAAAGEKNAVTATGGQETAQNPLKKPIAYKRTENIQLKEISPVEAAEEALKQWRNNKNDRAAGTSDWLDDRKYDEAGKEWKNRQETNYDFSYGVSKTGGGYNRPQSMDLMSRDAGVGGAQDFIFHLPTLTGFSDMWRDLMNRNDVSKVVNNINKYKPSDYSQSMDYQTFRAIFTMREPSMNMIDNDPIFKNYGDDRFSMTIYAQTKNVIEPAAARLADLKNTPGYKAHTKEKTQGSSVKLKRNRPEDTSDKGNSESKKSRDGKDDDGSSSAQQTGPTTTTTTTAQNT